MKKTTAALLAFLMLFSLCACGAAEAPAAPAPVESTPQPMAELRQADASVETGVRMNGLWSEAAARYEAMTGSSVTESAPEDATLLIADAETLLARAGSLAELGESAAYALLNERSYALRDSEGRIIGLPLELQSVAVAVNTELLEKAGYSLDALDGFKALRRFSTSVDNRKDELGFFAWAPMALADGSGLKLTQYLFNMSMYAELQQSGSFTGKYVGDYRDAHFKDLFTVMLDYGTKSGKDCNTVSDAESLEVFARGEALFCLMGSWELEALRNAGFPMEQLTFVPAWMGLEGEQDWGFVTDATLFAAVRAGEPAEEHAAEDFLCWALSDSESQLLLADLYEGMPYEGFLCSNPLLAQNAANDDAGLTAVPRLLRQLEKPEEWDSFFLSSLRTISPDNVVWRWQVTVWDLVDRWNGKK